MKHLTPILSAMALLGVACDDDKSVNGSDSGTDTNTGGDVSTSGASLALAFDNLPEIGSDFVYEGWVVGPNGPVSTGRFNKADDNQVGEGPDSANSPPFPGHDFITPTPVDLSTGHMAVISVEPIAALDDAAPFLIKPLAGPISADLMPTQQNLGAGPASVITGTATASANQSVVAFSLKPAHIGVSGLF